jgi:hypothetical protein
MCSSRFRAFGALMLATTLALVASLLWDSPVDAAPEPWQGTVATESLHVRSSPHSKAPSVGVLLQGEPITVLDWVTGEEVEPTNNTWAVLGEGQYVYSDLIRRNPPEGPPPLPEGVSFQGRWIDVNITQQLLTAYEGSEPVRVMVISAGRPDYPSPQGVHYIIRRVQNATMDSSTAPWIRDSYRLENVLYTQYFNEYGAALHLAYWKRDDSFGIPTSHGCVGMPLKEAEWLWNWAELGTPIYLHQ